MSEIKAKIQQDMKDAMRAKDKSRLAAIRLIMAAIKQVEVDQRITIDDAGILSILDKMAKQRRESIKQFEMANRNDLIEIEQFELDLIGSYLPKPLTTAEIELEIKTAIEQTEASSMKDMAKVMAILKPKFQGRADMAQVSKQIKDMLN